MAMSSSGSNTPLSAQLGPFAADSARVPPSSAPPLSAPPLAAGARFDTSAIETNHGEVAALALPAVYAAGAEILFVTGVLAHAARQMLSRPGDHAAIRNAALASIAGHLRRLPAEIGRQAVAALDAGPAALFQLVTRLGYSARHAPAASRPAPRPRTHAPPMPQRHATAAAQRPASHHAPVVRAPAASAPAATTRTSPPAAPTFSPAERAVAVYHLSHMLPTSGVQRALLKLGIHAASKPIVVLDSAQEFGAQLRRLDGLRTALSPAAWQALSRAGLGAELQAVRAQLNQLNAHMRSNAGQALSLMERGAALRHLGRPLSAVESRELQSITSRLSVLQQDIGQAFSALKLAGFYAGNQHPVAQQIRTWQANPPVLAPHARSPAAPAMPALPAASTAPSVGPATTHQEAPRTAATPPAAYRGGTDEPAQAAEPAAANPSATDGARPVAAPSSEPPGGEPCRPLMAYPLPGEEKKTGRPDQFEPDSPRFLVAPIPGAGPICPLDPSSIPGDIIKAAAKTAAYSGAVLGTAGTAIGVANGAGALGGAFFELGLREQRTGPKITTGNAADEYIKLRDNPDNYIAENYENGFAGMRTGDKFYNFSGHLLEIANPDDGTPYFFRRVPEDLYNALKAAQRARGNLSNEVFFPELVVGENGKASIQLVEIRPPFRLEPFRDAYFRVARGNNSHLGSFLVSFEAGFGRPEGQTVEANATFGVNYQFSSDLANTWRVGFTSPTEKDFYFGHRKQVTNYWSTLRLGAGSMVFNGAQAIDHTDLAAPFSGELLKIGFSRLYLDVGDRLRVEAAGLGKPASSIPAYMKTMGGFGRVRRTGVVELGLGIDFYKWDNLNGKNGNHNGYFEGQVYPFDLRLQQGGKGNSFNPLTPFNLDPSLQYTVLDKNWTPLHAIGWSAPPLKTDKPTRIVGLDMSKSQVAQLTYPETLGRNRPSATQVTGHSSAKGITLADGQRAVLARIGKVDYLTVQGRVFEVPRNSAQVLACLRYFAPSAGQPARLDCVANFRLPPLSSGTGPAPEQIATLASQRGARLTVPAGTVYFSQTDAGKHAVLFPNSGGEPQRFDVTLWPDRLVRDYFKLLPANANESHAAPQAEPRLAPRAPAATPATPQPARAAGATGPADPTAPSAPIATNAPDIRLPAPALPATRPSGDSRPATNAPGARRRTPLEQPDAVQQAATEKARAESARRAQLNSAMRQDADQARELMARSEPLLRRHDGLTEASAAELSAVAAELAALRPRIDQAFAQLKQAGYYIGDEHPLLRQLDPWLTRANEMLNQPSLATPAPADPPAAVQPQEQPASPNFALPAQPQPAPAEPAPAEPPGAGGIPTAPAAPEPAIAPEQNSAPAQVLPPEAENPQPDAPRVAAPADAGPPEVLQPPAWPVEPPLQYNGAWRGPVTGQTPSATMQSISPLAANDGPDLAVIVDSATQSQRQFSVARGTVLVAELGNETYAAFLPNDGTEARRFRVTGLTEAAIRNLFGPL